MRRTRREAGRAQPNIKRLPIMNTVLKQTGLALGVLFLMAVHTNQSATATPIFSTRLLQAGALFASGTDSVSGSVGVAGGGFASGTVDIVGTEITSTAVSSRGTGTTPQTNTEGSYTYFDLIFSNILSPADTGDILVSANFFLDWNTSDPNTFQDFVQVSADINEGPVEFSTSFDNQGTFNIATPDVLVPLNEAVPFSASHISRFTDSVVGPETGDILFRLVDFTLPDGFTVNSAEAGIVNNFQVSASAVPEPTALPLFLGGLAGLAGLGFMKRRRKAT